MEDSQAEFKQQKKKSHFVIQGIAIGFALFFSFVIAIYYSQTEYGNLYGMSFWIIPWLLIIILSLLNKGYTRSALAIFIITLLSFSPLIVPVAEVQSYSLEVKNGHLVYPDDFYSSRGSIFIDSAEQATYEGDGKSIAFSVYEGDFPPFHYRDDLGITEINKNSSDYLGKQKKAYGITGYHWGITDKFMNWTFFVLGLAAFGFFYWRRHPKNL